MGTMSYGGLCDWSLHTRPRENGYCTSSGVLFKFKKPKVSAVRDFPPGCGPNELLKNLMSQDQRLHTRPMENGYCTSSGVLLKFKKPKLAAVRDFPPGCGPNALLNNLMSQETKGEASLMDEENSVADEKTVNDTTYDCVKISETGNGPLSHQLVKNSVMSELPDLFDLEVKLVAAAEKVKGVQASSLAHNVPEDSKWLHGVEVQAAVKSEGAAERGIVSEISSMVDGLITPGASKVGSPPQWPISDATILKETALKNKYDGRRVSANRDFPPFCGRNAPQATEEERMVVILGNKSFGASVEASVKGELSRERVRVKEEGYSVGETAWSQIEERDVGVQDGNALKKVLKGLVPESNNNSQKAVVRAEVEGAPLRVKARANDGNFRDGNAQKRKLKGSVLERKTKFQKVTHAQPQNGSSPSGQRGHDDLDVDLPPFGPNGSSHGTIGNKVWETLRLFRALCRKLLRVEESKLWKQGHISKRIDLQADKIIRARGIKAGKQVIGSVPGIEVNDQFQYRVELALAGLHRPYQGGIDYMKHGGMIIATSIVSSGSYGDDLDNPDVLIYSGHGGNLVGQDKQPEDQKLERGNLALKNSISAKNPVRVVHGSKETKASSSDARAKIVLTYNYHGLYTVERYWHEVGPHGKLVYMFELKRMPGQPELAWKEAKKLDKCKVREGLCVGDIPGGKEFPFVLSTPKAKRNC